MEIILRQLKYVNWLVQKQYTSMYHQNHEGMTVGASLAIYSHKSVAGDLIILGGTQLQGIKMCSVLHRS